MAPQPLTEEDLHNLSYYSRFGPADSYYKLLVSKGYDYAALALGVVEQNTFSGVIAKLYAQKVASDHGITLTDDQWSGITKDLARADLIQRVLLYAEDRAEPPVLSWEQIKDYHVQVFSNYGLPPEAWTAYTMLNASNNPEAIWQNLLETATTVPFDNFASFIGDLLSMASVEQTVHYHELFTGGGTDVGINPSTFGNTEWMVANAPALYQLQILNSPSFYFNAILQKFGADAIRFGHIILGEANDFLGLLQNLSQTDNGLAGDMLEIGAAHFYNNVSSFGREWASLVTGGEPIWHQGMLVPAYSLINPTILAAGATSLLNFGARCEPTFKALDDNAIITKETGPDGRTKYYAEWFEGEGGDDDEDLDFPLELDKLVFVEGDELKKLGNELYIVAYDPLILDLNGNGIETLSISEGKGSAFDLLGEDGLFADHGWIGPNDAFLAIDLNGNGNIDDISELFGDGRTSGFEMLAQYDFNGDGKIDRLDEVFDKLILWMDVNGDGLSQVEEISSLTEMNIVSISLEYNQSFSDNNGNFIKSTGGFTFADGREGEIADVNFTVDLSTLTHAAGNQDIFGYS
ncbi:hypothetical protein IAE29_10060 [Ochrobactrum sp. S46]|nr:hypothetical protein [Ochrobactrum sp. S45]MBK0043675.1 hypothetical protein [Ochrobactrum sp. S46]